MVREVVRDVLEMNTEEEKQRGGGGHRRFIFIYRQQRPTSQTQPTHAEVSVGSLGIERKSVKNFLEEVLNGVVAVGRLGAILFHPLPPLPWCVPIS